MEATTIIAILNSFFVLAVFALCAPKIDQCLRNICQCFGVPAINEQQEVLLNNGQQEGRLNECLPGFLQRLFGRNGNPPPVPSDSLIIKAENLDIEHSENPEYWKLIEDPRFTVVAELSKVWWLEIKATINFRTLSANTKYGAYLIYKTTPDSVGLHVLQEASVSVGSIQEKKNVCLKESRRAPRNRNVVGLPVEKDGWMELELGQFECDNVTDDKKAEISIMETDGHNEKRGLIIAGIEIRPI